MASLFDNYWNNRAEPVHQREFGDEATYTSPAGETKQIRKPILTREIQERRYNQYGGYDFVTVRSARFPRAGYEDLSADGEIQIGDLNYSIESIAKIEGKRIQLNLKRIDVGEITAPNHFRG